jgi:tetratricopeptide (TPR) repeat protein
VQQLESITSQPKIDNVVARRALAWTHIEKKEFDRAVEELSKAGDLNPKDPWLHYYLALVRYHLAQTGEATGGLPNMMQDLRQVLDWDAEFAQARSMLAMAQLEGGGVHAAVDSMRVALTLSPRNQTYLLNMAQIYMAGKSWEAATLLLERLKSSPDPEVAKSAGEQLAGLPMLKKYGTLAQPQQTASASSPSPSPSTSPASPSPASSSPTPRSAAAPSTTAPSATSKKPAAPQTKTEQQSPEPDEVTVDRADEPPAPAQPDKRAIQFLKGKLVAVDCSQAPSAILTVSAGAKVLKLRTPDYKSLTLIGADNFSCDWKGRTVAVNYRAGGKADGDLVSIEVQ